MNELLSSRTWNKITCRSALKLNSWPVVSNLQHEPDSARKGANWKYFESGETLFPSYFCSNLHVNINFFIVQEIQKPVLHGNRTVV